MPTDNTNPTTTTAPETINDTWQQRANTAEARLGELAATLSETREALSSSERRREIDAELAHSEALDIESARILTEAAVAAMSEPDVAKAVADLKKRKPFLFRSRRPHPSGMSAASRPQPADDLVSIADHARATGDRRALLRYLRARREV